jgi:hypothetical protein
VSRLKRPRDLNQWAKQMVDLATGAAQEPKGKAPQRAKGGALGGKARASQITCGSPQTRRRSPPPRRSAPWRRSSRAGKPGIAGRTAQARQARVVTLLDNHLQSALTRYGLAGVLVISFLSPRVFRHAGLWLRGAAGRRRGRAAAAGHFAFLVKRSAFLSVWHASAPGGGSAARQNSW